MYLRNAMIGLQTKARRCMRRATDRHDGVKFAAPPVGPKREGPTQG